jgi:hypothetical protein
MVIGLVGGSLGILIVALAPNIAAVLAGWCIAQLLFNAPGIAPAILAIGGVSYGVLYTVAGLCAIIGALAILPVKRVR